MIYEYVWLDVHWQNMAMFNGKKSDWFVAMNLILHGVQFGSIPCWQAGHVTWWKAPVESSMAVRWDLACSVVVHTSVSWVQCCSSTFRRQTSAWYFHRMRWKTRSLASLHIPWKYCFEAMNPTWTCVPTSITYDICGKFQSILGVKNWRSPGASVKNPGNLWRKLSHRR